jgi:hypothetical protein
MKRNKQTNEVNREQNEVGTALGLRPGAQQVIEGLLAHRTRAAGFLSEASVHRPSRGKKWVATFTGPQGGQIWRTTGTTDHDKALLLARHWEREASEERAKVVRSPLPRFRVRRSDLGVFTQREVARILKMSERAVREVEHRAIRKLLNHPSLKRTWQAYLSGDLDEGADGALTPAELSALFTLARTPAEFELLEKLLELMRLTNLGGA